MQAFKWTGWLLATIGAAFVVAAIAWRDQGPSLVITLSIVGAVMLLMGLLFVAIGAASIANEKLRAEVAATGRAGTATITGTEFTGTLINDVPQYRITVNVSLPDRLIYQATVTQLIRQGAGSRYEPGAVFPCRVKTDDLGFVVLIDDTGVVRSGPDPALAGGVPALATVLGLFDPPPTDLDGPQLGLRLRVTVDDGRPPYEVKLATGYPARSTPPRKGTKVAVRVDPEEPRRVAVDWGDQPRPIEPGPESPASGSDNALA